MQCNVFHCCGACWSVCIRSHCSWRHSLLKAYRFPAMLQLTPLRCIHTRVEITHAARRSGWLDTVCNSVAETSYQESEAQSRHQNKLLHFSYLLRHWRRPRMKSEGCTNVCVPESGQMCDQKKYCATPADWINIDSHSPFGSFKLTTIWPERQQKCTFGVRTFVYVRQKVRHRWTHQH